MPVKADFVFDFLDAGYLLTPRSSAAKAWVEENLPERTMRGEALFFAAEDGKIDAIIRKAEWEGLLTYDRRVADMTERDHDILDRALRPQKGFQMLAPSLSSRMRRSAGPASAAANPAASSEKSQDEAAAPAAAAERVGQKDKGQP
jgi:hypothetical protein